jgi:hypothetical protein
MTLASSHDAIISVREGSVIIIFGWVKEAKEAGPALDCYCYRCHCKRAWEHWKETEWVSFFMIKAIPFLWKSYVVCAACRQPIELDSMRLRQLGRKEQLPNLAEFIEERQLLGKNEVQRNFLFAQRAQSDGG